MAQGTINKPKIDLSWFWILAISAIVIFGFMGGSNSPSEITKRSFVDTMLRSGNIEKIVVIGGETPLAEVFVKEQKVENYRRDPRWKNIPDKGPHFYFGIAGAPEFEAEFRDTLAASKFPRNVPLTFENKRNSWSDLLISAIPFIILIGFLIFMSRRMSGGTGGAGGGVFSVGKAKARLFDKDNDTKVTFKDVAGMEEAKVEVVHLGVFCLLCLLMSMEFWGKSWE